MKLLTNRMKITEMKSIDTNSLLMVAQILSLQRTIIIPKTKNPKLKHQNTGLFDQQHI